MPDSGHRIVLAHGNHMRDPDLTLSYVQVGSIVGFKEYMWDDRASPQFGMSLDSGSYECSFETNFGAAVTMNACAMINWDWEDLPIGSALGIQYYSGGWQNAVTYSRLPTEYLEGSGFFWFDTERSAQRWRVRFTTAGFGESIYIGELLWLETVNEYAKGIHFPMGDSIQHNVIEVESPDGGIFSQRFANDVSTFTVPVKNLSTANRTAIKAATANGSADRLIYVPHESSAATTANGADLVSVCEFVQPASRESWHENRFDKHAITLQLRQVV